MSAAMVEEILGDLDRKRARVREPLAVRAVAVGRVARAAAEAEDERRIAQSGPPAKKTGGPPSFQTQRGKRSTIVATVSGFARRPAFRKA